MRSLSLAVMATMLWSLGFSRKIGGGWVDGPKKFWNGVLGGGGIGGGDRKSRGKAGELGVGVEKEQVEEEEGARGGER